jgi:hypothetical protein
MLKYHGHELENKKKNRQNKEIFQLWNLGSEIIITRGRLKLRYSPSTPALFITLRLSGIHLLVPIKDLLWVIYSAHTCTAIKRISCPSGQDPNLQVPELDQHLHKVTTNHESSKTERQTSCYMEEDLTREALKKHTTTYDHRVKHFTTSRHFLAAAAKSHPRTVPGVPQRVRLPDSRARPPAVNPEQLTQAQRTNGSLRKQNGRRN